MISLVIQSRSTQNLANTYIGALFILDKTSLKISGGNLFKMVREKLFSAMRKDLKHKNNNM